MIGASEPISVRISHSLGQAEAKRRIDSALAAIHREVAQYVKSLDYHWDEDRLEFRAAILLQVISGHIDVYDDHVQIEFTLPRLLHMAARKIAGRIESRGATLLEGPKGRS
jgi:hypothetical protein